MFHREGNRGSDQSQNLLRVSVRWRPERSPTSEGETFRQQVGLRREKEGSQPPFAHTKRQGLPAGAVGHPASVQPNNLSADFLRSCEIF